MKLEVPFYKQESDDDCGPTALRMALAFLDRDYSLDEIKKLMNINPKKGVSTIRIAITAAKFGYKTEFYSTSLSFNKENLNLDFYKNYIGESDVNESEQLVSEAKESGILLEERLLKLDEILSKMSENSLPIILLDWNVILSRKGYHGHFVPIDGYDDDFIYVHNQGSKDTKEYFQIKRDLFEKARKSQGTDEDILFIHRNI